MKFLQEVVDYYFGRSWQHPEKFLPRDAMHKRGLCLCAVSVWMSVTFVYFVETAKRIIKLISTSGSHIILAFSCQTLWQYSDGNP